MTVEWNGASAMLLMMVDITARKRAEVALARYNLLAEQTRDIILFIRRDGHIVDANQAAVVAYGYERDTLLTLNITNLRDPHTLPQVAPQMAEADQSGLRFETVHRRKDGSTFPVEVSSSGADIGGERVLLSIIRDITDRKQAEAALQQVRAELERRVQERTTALQQEMAERQRLEREAQRAQHFALLGRLAAGVSHEIRNPLGAVFLHVDLLEEELRQPSPDSAVQIAQSFTEIKIHLARLDDLVQDYLSLVRVSTIQRTVQDLGVAMRAWGAEFEAQAALQGVRLQLVGVEALGMVAFHAGTLYRALLNLVQNALDAMPQGGTLTLTGQSTATQVQLQVQDTGSGIPAKSLKQIFEPLSTTKPGGTGLGLYIVQEIMAAHAGQVTVQSTVGQGSIFTLTLPQAAVAAST
jgi:PAS domain S-box-containing protein